MSSIGRPAPSRWIIPRVGHRTGGRAPAKAGGQSFNKTEYSPVLNLPHVLEGRWRRLVRYDAHPTEKAFRSRATHERLAFRAAVSCHKPTPLLGQSRLKVSVPRGNQFSLVRSPRRQGKGSSGGGRADGSRDESGRQARPRSLRVSTPARGRWTSCRHALGRRVR